MKTSHEIHATSIGARIQELIESAMTEDSAAITVNDEFDKEYSGEDIITIYEGGRVE